MRAVVRLRGDVNIQGSVRDTLGMLNLHRVNHCAFVPESDSSRGMIAKVNDYVAFGEPSQDVVETLLRRRGEPAEAEAVADGGADAGDAAGRAVGSVDDEWVADNTEYDDVADLARALHADETTLRKAGLAPVLRLHPPRGGHDGLKRPASGGGQLGEHTTEEIDALLTAMR